MKLQHNPKLNNEFAKIDNLTYYPYVGEDFYNQDKRVMVYAHNIYCESWKYEKELIRTSSKTHFADALEEFAYQKGFWTKSFRNFIKGALGLTRDYSEKSDKNTIDLIDSFVSKISYTNFIDGLVKSDVAINVTIDNRLIQKSRDNQKKILEILNITHCISWGAKVYNHIIHLEGYEIIESRPLTKKGFGYAKIRNLKNGQVIHVLKTFHPSMPSFGQLKKETHDIFSWFFSLDK